MANLFNKYIYETYKSIIGIGQSGTSGLTTTLQPLTDGEGKELPIEVSETEVNITAPTTVPNLFIEGYGEVIDEQGYWRGEGGGGGGGGTSGTSGSSGLTGTSGTSGTNGTSGTAGTSGRNGYNGLNGSAGTNGTSGTDGSGTSGTSGLTGSSGTSGTSGGGAGGLVNGTGTSSLKNADSLVTTPAQANGNAGIALGNGAKANGAESVAIGEFSESLQTGCAAIGQYSEASALYASAWGRTAAARSEGSVAFGQQALVPPSLPGAVAMGRQVIADKADTTHVRALKVVAPDGGIGGNGIILLSPNGTEYTLTVSNAGALVITATI